MGFLSVPGHAFGTGLIRPRSNGQIADFVKEITEYVDPNAPPPVNPNTATLQDTFSNTLQHGVFGKAGIQQVLDKVRSSAGFQRRKTARGMRRGGIGRRLGPRSGAVDTAIINADAPQRDNQLKLEAELMRINQLSKTGVGAEGLSRLIDQARERYDSESGRINANANKTKAENQDDGNGALDWAIGIGSFFL